LKWLLDPESPFYIKPRFDLKLLSWLWQFQAACNEARMQRVIPLLRDLSQASLALYEELMTQEGLECCYRQNGLLTIFGTGHGYEEGLAEARLLQAYGLPLTILDATATRAREPIVGAGIVGGILFHEDAHLNPALFVQGLARCVQEQGGKLKTGTELLGFETARGRIVTVKTTRGDFQPDQVVLAAGAWSPRLGQELRLKLPIQPAKGYSLTVKRPASGPGLPLVLGEARVAVTPMGPLLRFAGTLELAGFDFTINRRRVNAILRAVGDYLPAARNLELIEIWRGLRPCTPDGLPLIGRSASFENLMIATGHAMLGVSLGPVTGKLVAQLAAEQTPLLDLTALRVERFH